MTCPNCIPWCATTEDQLANRQRNMLVGGTPYLCPKCGSNEWATSREMIAATPKRGAGWRGWMKKPGWRASRAMNLIAVVFFVGLAIAEDTRWIALADAFGAGINLAMAYHATMIMRTMVIIDGMKVAFDSMCEINRGLVEAQVGTLTLRLAQVEEGDTPIAPNRLN